MQNMVPRTTLDLFLSVDPYYRQQPNISLEKKREQSDHEQREHRDPWNHHQPRGANPSRQDLTEILIITNVQEVVFPNRGFNVCKRYCCLQLVATVTCRNNSILGIF